MKKMLAILLLLPLLHAAATAQNIATGERAPKLKKVHRWLDNIQPRQTDYTYIEFVRSTSAPCLESCLRIKDFLDHTERPFRAVFVSCEPAEHVDFRLRDCSGEYIGTILDTEGEIFDAYGVRYVPFGVIIDKRRRVLWFGNPLTAENDFVKKITER